MARSEGGKSLSKIIGDLRRNLSPINKAIDRRKKFDPHTLDLESGTKLGDFATRMSKTMTLLERAEKLTALAESNGSSATTDGTDMKDFATVIELSSSFVPNAAVGKYFQVLADSVVATDNVVTHWKQFKLSQDNLDYAELLQPNDFRVPHIDAVFGIRWARDYLGKNTLADEKFERLCPDWGNRGEN
mgnify:CR=1 FL=1